MPTFTAHLSSLAAHSYQPNPVRLPLKLIKFHINDDLSNVDLGSPRPPSPSGRERSRSPGASPNHLYLYLPYLHFDTYLNIIRRRNIIEYRMQHGRARPVPEEVAKLESLEARVIWEYIGHDPPLNARRTLDQYGYPSLRDTYARDDDQMLYKLTKERLTSPLKKRPGTDEVRDNSGTARHGKERSPLISPGSPMAMNVDSDMPMKPERVGIKYESEEDLEADILDGNVLMVDQLWLWAVDTSKSCLSPLVLFAPRFIQDI